MKIPKRKNISTTDPTDLHFVFSDKNGICSVQRLVWMAGGWGEGSEYVILLYVPTFLGPNGTNYEELGSGAMLTSLPLLPWGWRCRGLPWFEQQNPR
jgi:hypothetical protein